MGLRLNLYTLGIVRDHDSTTRTFTYTGQVFYLKLKTRDV